MKALYTIPKGQSGDWRVECFEVTEEDENFGCLRAVVSGSGRFVPAGQYTRLMRNRTVVSSDTPDEIQDQQEAIY